MTINVCMLCRKKKHQQSICGRIMCRSRLMCVRDLYPTICGKWCTFYESIGFVKVVVICVNCLFCDVQIRSSSTKTILSSADFWLCFVSCTWNVKIYLYIFFSRIWQNGVAAKFVVLSCTWHQYVFFLSPKHLIDELTNFLCWRGAFMRFVNQTASSGTFTIQKH